MTSSSTQAWLQNLPATWNVKKIRALFFSRDERNTELQEDNILSVMKDIGVIRYEDKGNVGNKSSDRPENYKIVYPNDIVANSMNLVIGSLGIAKEKGVTSSVYHILAKHEKEVLPEFYEYVMRSSAFQRYAGSLGKGIMQLREAVRWEVLRNIEVPAPDPIIQQSIVNHLDKKLEKIDLFVKNKESYIEKLLERKKNVINELVTHGVNPNAEFAKTSEWLQASPATWSLKKLKFLAKPRTDNGTLENGAITKIALENIEGFTGKFIESDESFEGRGTSFYKGDVLFGKLRPYLGKAYIAEFSGQCVTDIIPLSIDTNQADREFIFYRIISTDFIDEVNSSTYGTKMPRANWRFIGNLRIPYPTIAEQRDIVSAIKTETKTLDKAVAKSRQQIELIKEYRDSLITNAITGQIRIEG